MKGNKPDIMQNNTTPKLQISALSPKKSEGKKGEEWNRISGGRYSFVPTNFGILFLSPKVSKSKIA